MLKKKTGRIQRDDAIDALLEDSSLDELLDRVEKKHLNGGVFADVAHHKRTQVCITALTEEELEEEE